MKRLLPLVLLAACGPGGSSAHDAAIDGHDNPGEDSGRPDAPQTDCAYTEESDATNDTTEGGTAEQSGLTLSGPTKVCGTFNSTHFDGDITVDVDAYRFTTATDMDLVVRLVADAQPVEYAGIDIYSGATFNKTEVSITWYGGHGVGTVHLAAGTYELTPFALSSAAIAADIPYSMKIETFDPATLCPTLTTGGYSEATDGANNTGNDVYSIPSGSPIVATANANDAPEMSNITLTTAPGRITGSAADVTMADQYEDRDTYTFATGPGINELTVRADWTAAADVDFIVFDPADTSTPITPIVRSIKTSNTAPELRTFAVKSNTTYRLLVAAAVGGTFPVAYTATLCGASF
ncbi:MAG TPA: hypothetical protein VGM39_14460 [Kofleriaceae bacterium]|jgi:hypothetical protein